MVPELVEGIEKKISEIMRKYNVAEIRPRFIEHNDTDITYHYSTIKGRKVEQKAIIYRFNDLVLIPESAIQRRHVFDEYKDYDYVITYRTPREDTH